ncbi:MAG: hypothetical protein OXG78_14540 [Chloroflexi bacterium]|nr:hypothetical protein [Chloroflexota bacterium]
MRILFWNIKHGGGSRAGNIVEQILEWNPDIIALAEFRGTAPSQSIVQRLFDEGYEHQVSAVNADEPTWNAVFLASRFKLNHVAQSLPEVPYGDLYWLLAKVETDPVIHVGVMHAPWSIYLGRLEYYAALLNVTRDWQLGRGVIIGDTNAGISGLDEETENSVEYNESFMKPMSSLGWHDIYRSFHPNANTPTWYSPYGNGYRLDQAFVNAELQPCVTSCTYDWGKNAESGGLSDHAAILLDLNLPD